MSENRNLIPPFIQKKYLSNEFAGNFEAIGLFVDISGFTQMTDALMTHGREGTEVLSDILSYLFEPTVHSIYAHQGFVITYAGDAFTALFILGDDPQQTARQAWQAASDIHGFFTENNRYESRFGAFTFGAKIGLGLGNVKWGITGSERKKLYYFRGQAVDDSAHAEHYAEQGEVWASNSFLALAKDFLSLPVSTERSFTQIKKPKTIAQSPKEISISPPSAEVLKVFSGEREANFPEGEFREVVAIFISFENLPDLDSFIQSVFELQERYGCSRPALDFGDKGGNILLFSGAPITYENKETRALQFISELFAQAAPSAQLRAGIAKGILYVGFNGAKIHQEFSCLGTTTNQAARFMMKAQWGQVLVDENIAQNPRFQFQYLGEIAYKGRMQKVPTHALKAEASQEKRSILSTSTSSAFKLQNTKRLVGREKELKQLENRLTPIQNGKFGGVVYIHGEAGLGKSHLVQAFKERIFSRTAHPKQIPYKWFYMPCDEIFQKSFNPLIYFLKDYFNQSKAESDTEKKANFENQFNLLFQKTQITDLKQELKRNYSILGALIDLHWENSLYSQLDAKGRYENTLSAVKNLIKAESLLHPLIIELEDGHWLDEGTKDFLGLLTRNVADHPFIIISACRYKDDGSRVDFSLRDVPEHHLDLQQIAKDDLQLMAAHLLSEKGHYQSIPAETQNFIYARSDGNPFFIEQISLYLKEEKLLDAALNLTSTQAGSNARFRIPSTINEILIARVDRLTQELKEIVKTASVLGREFAVSILSAVLLKIREGAHRELDDYLDAGENDAIWEALTEIRYIFKHGLIREAVYEMQLKKQLRTLHKLAAEAFEEIYSESLAPHYFELAEHYERAQILEKAVFYLERAGDTARQAYRNREALHHYTRLLQYPLSPQVELKALLNSGKIQEDMGEWGKAVETYRRFLVRAEELGDQKQIARGANYLAWLLTQQGGKKEAVAWTERAYKIALELGDKQELAYSLKNRGTIEKHFGETEKARQTHTELLALAEELDDFKNISSAFFQLRSHLLEEKNLIEIFEKYLKIAEEIGNRREMGNLYFFMGDICLLKQDYEQAEIYNQKMYEVVKETGEKRGMCYAIGDRGIIYAEMGRLEESLLCYEEKLDIAKELGDGYNIWEGQINMGHTYFVLKKYAEAEELVRKSLETSQKYELKPEEYYSREAETDLALEMGKLEKAEAALKEATRLAEELESDEFIFECKVMACQVGHLAGDPNAAIKLEKLLPQATQEKGQAPIYLELWKMTGKEAHRKEALKRYKNLYAQTKRHVYKLRVEILESQEI